MNSPCTNETTGLGRKVNAGAAASKPHIAEYHMADQGGNENEIKEFNKGWRRSKAVKIDVVRAEQKRGSIVCQENIGGVVNHMYDMGVANNLHVMLCGRIWLNRPF